MSQVLARYCGDSCAQKGLTAGSLAQKHGFDIWDLFFVLKGKLAAKGKMRQVLTQELGLSAEVLAQYEREDKVR